MLLINHRVISPGSDSWNFFRLELPLQLSIIWNKQLEFNKIIPIFCLFPCFVFVFVFVFWDMVSLYSPGYPATHCAYQAGLELMAIPLHLPSVFCVVFNSGSCSAFSFCYFLPKINFDRVIWTLKIDLYIHLFSLFIHSNLFSSAALCWNCFCVITQNVHC